MTSQQPSGQSLLDQGYNTQRRGWQTRLESGPAPFEVRIKLSKALVGFDLPHLDALLQWAVVQEATDGRGLPKSDTPYFTDLPLQIMWQDPQWGVPLYNSSTFAPTRPEKVKHYTETYVKNTKVSEFLPLAQKDKNGGLWEVNIGSGQFKAYKTPMAVTLVSEILAYGSGDVQEVIRLLQILEHVGTLAKKRAWGFGKILSISVIHSDYPYPLPAQGWCIARPVADTEERGGVGGIELLRPVPMAALSALGLSADAGQGQYLGYSPPYWLEYNKVVALPEGQICLYAPTGASSVATGNTTSPLELSLSEFLHRAHSNPGGNQENYHLSYIARHPKFVAGAGQGERDAVTGRPIQSEDGGAIRRQDAISPKLGDAVDVLKASSSGWASNASAIIMSQSILFHQSLAAFEARQLYFPTFPAKTGPGRIRWRELILDLPARIGQSCLLLMSNSVNRRRWPFARLGLVGRATPFYLYHADYNFDSLLSLDVIKLAQLMLEVEVLLDNGYGKGAIETNLFEAQVTRKPGFDFRYALENETRLKELRLTPEFYPALLSARAAKERKT